MQETPHVPPLVMSQMELVTAHKTKARMQHFSQSKGFAMMFCTQGSLDNRKTTSESFLPCHFTTTGLGDMVIRPRPLVFISADQMSWKLRESLTVHPQINARNVRERGLQSSYLSNMKSSSLCVAFTPLKWDGGHAELSKCSFNVDTKISSLERFTACWKAL